MWCPGCETDYEADARFCEECGTRLARRCGQCGHAVSPTAKFCRECGNPLGNAPAASAPPAPETSPHSYTPRHLAEKILASRASLEGERKQVTVLFADIKGSTELIAGLDTEDAQRLLDGAVQVMMAAVHRFEGTVSRMLGDGVMALFGAPIAHEDHAVRACYAALACQDGIRRYAEGVFAQHGLRVEARVGLNSGEVVVRLISDDLHMDYTAMGQTVHLASRMEQLAREGTTLLTTETLELAEGYVQARSLGRAPVKGLAEPIEVFELAGIGAARTRLQAASVRGLSQFVGRDEEIGLLYRALERAGSGQGQVVALVGEPGVGKSRLVWEVTHSHRAAGWQILESSSVSYGRATSYLPVIDLLKGYCRIEATDDARAVREKLTGKLLALDESLKDALTPLLALLDVTCSPSPAVRERGLGGEGSTWHSLDPARRRRLTLDALKRLLLRESREQPLLLVFEDLHWVDSETQALLDELVESLPTERILLLVNYRPEYRHAWKGEAAYSELRIEPLPPESAEALLGPLLGEDDSLAPVRRLLIERTGGNPFFLEESVRGLVETGVLDGERGAYRLARAVEEVRVPATVQAILAARIDRLSLPSDKRLLQAAAVVGKDVPFRLLQAIADLTEEQLQRGLARLQSAELLTERSLFPDLILTFKHALTHEVTYGTLLHDRRRTLHARLVSTIEDLAGDRLGEQVDRLAHHAVRGEAWSKAVPYLRQAYARVMSHSAQREAVGYAEQALTALEHLPDGPAKTEQAIDIRFELRHALWFLGEFGRVRAVLGEAEQLARALGDRRRQGWCALYVCTWYYGAGEHSRAVTTGRHALELSEGQPDERLRIQAHVNLGQAHAARTEYAAGIEVLTHALALLDGPLTTDRLGQATIPSVLARVNLVRCLVELGRFSEASTFADEAVRIAETVDHPGSLSIACWSPGLVAIRRGEFDRAIPVLERGVEIARELGLSTFTHWVAPSLGQAYALSGRTAEAVALLESALAYDQSVSLFSQHTLMTLYLAEALLLDGRIDDALTEASEGLRQARERQERGYQARAHWLLGEVTARLDPEGDRAVEEYREAIRIAGELGMRPLIGQCRLGLGQIAARTGDREGAREHLEAAAAIFRELELGHWLDRVETTLAELASETGGLNEERSER